MNITLTSAVANRLLRSISRYLMACTCIAVSTAATTWSAELSVLFLGDNGHHRPRDRFIQLQPVLAARGIQLTYADDVQDLNPETLGRYDALLLYANIDLIEPAQAKSLLDYVSAGKGFVPLHCATYCFRNNAEIVALMGAQFQRHGTGVFRTQIANGDHPIMRQFGGFESWDETYVHHLHNEKDRTVLSYRIDQDGREPWTWVRTHGKGRVFYTAWGHDQRTWGNPGFQNLVERGIRWAAGQDLSSVPAFLDEASFPVPEMTQLAEDIKPFEYIDVGKEIPNYRPSAQGEPFSQMQKPLEPSESMKHMVTPVGFRVELFAADPDLQGKPITMDWDERGRLWVCETYDYPNELQPLGKGRDRIRICEDTDGDGRADKFTVFAEELSIPSTLTFYRGGVILQDGIETVYLKDTDGDDRADTRRVMFTGWAMGDTHGGVSNFQYGLDNWIWAMQGYNNSRPTNGISEPLAFRMGFFRFRPDGSEIEFLRSTNNNTWGLGLSEEGIVFGSTANRNPSVYMPIPNRYYESVRGWTPSLMLGTIADTHLFKPITDNVRQVDHHGGYTAGAGHALYTARRYPREYWNRVALVNGPTGHLVGVFVLSRDGADYHSTNPFNLLASNDEWTAPIRSEVGPDGNVWVVDWYNYIVQHNPTPHGFKTGKGAAYETKLRDKRHGRIYRLVYGSERGDEPFSLAGANPNKLVLTLRHPTMLWRKHAQRLLVERGKQDVLPSLYELAGDRSVDEIGLNVGAIHALWTIHGLGALDGRNDEATRVAMAALKHASAGVRRVALMVLPNHLDSVPAILAAGLLSDGDAQVRLASFLALADLSPHAAAGEAIVAAMTRPENFNDRWIPDAAISAAARHDLHALAAAAKVSQPTTKLIELTRVVSQHYARGGPADSVAELVASLKGATPDVTSAILDGLSNGWPKGSVPKMDDALESQLERIATRLPANSRGTLVRLAGQWGSRKLQELAAEVTESLLESLADGQISAPERLAAASLLMEFRPSDDEVVELMLECISPQTPPDVAVGIVRALQASEADGVGTAIIEGVAGMTPGIRQAAFAVLLGRPDSTQAMLKAIEQGDVQLGELSLDQKQTLSAHPDEGIRQLARALLERGGVLPNADRQKVLDTLLPIAKQKGDAAAGKQVFTKQCAKCHRHSGEGENIGPDLTGMAVHPKEELLTNIVDPSRSVEGNFRLYMLSTNDGELLSGMLAAESRTAVELVDTEGKRRSVLREDIEELDMSMKSLMPDGFEEQISKQEITDLLEFLTQRGKYLPLDCRKVATISSVRGMFNSKESNTERLVFPDWSPKTFEGVPFLLLDPQDGRIANTILLHGPQGAIPPTMPKNVTLPCNSPVQTIHMLSGVSGWGFPLGEKGSVSMVVRLHYEDGQIEDHPLKNGEHFSDYIRRIDVPGSKFAYQLRGQQLRYLTVHPRRPETIQSIELVKGNDSTAPIVMAITVEARS